MFAEESARWREDSRTVRSARPDQNGQFSIKGLPPGNYLTLKLHAERVSLAEGESTQIDLTLQKQIEAVGAP